jgi:hypothetical protein
VAPWIGDLEPSRELRPVKVSPLKLRALVLMVSVIGISLFVTAGTASGVGAITVSNASPAAGATITMTSTGWSAGHEVIIAVTGAERALARVAADASGSVHARVTIPENVNLDFNLLSVTGTAASGVPQQIVTPLAVHRAGHAPVPTRPWPLVLVLLAIAAALLVVSLMTTKPAARLAAN